MRPTTLCLILTLGLATAPLTSGAAQQDTAAPARKPPSKAKAVVKKLVDTAATAAAGAGVQSLLGKKAAGVANALGAGAGSPCSPATAGSSGAAIVGVAKALIKKTTDSVPAAAAIPCPPASQIPGLPPGGIPGMPAAPDPAAALRGASPMGGLGAVAAATPIGMAVAAAPLAGSAVKGIKGMLGGKPQDKIAMLRELGKGKLELKGVKFIEGTAELEPGFEPSLAALGEAIGLAEGTYILHVAAEAGEKGTEPDTVLAHKRIQKVWAAILVNGVPDQRIIAVAVLPKEMSEGRKPAKRGQARVEIIRLSNTP